MGVTTVDESRDPNESGAGHDEQDYLWTLNFGPQHPATHTTLRIVLKLDGERVVEAVPDIGYLHSGFEKIGEPLDYNQYVTVTDRMNYISPMANNVAWHYAVENLLGIEPTKRCQYIRVIISELSRISDHLLSTGAMGLDTGAFTFFLYAFYQREVIYDIYESLCGARFTNSYTRVGGVMHDMTDVTIEKIREFLRNFPKTLADMERLLNRNRIFVDRTKNVGILTKEEAINRSASGPVARASGVARDLRIDEPYFKSAVPRLATVSHATTCGSRKSKKVSRSSSKPWRICHQAPPMLASMNGPRCRPSKRFTRPSKAPLRTSNW